MYDAFISYRRAGGITIAKMLREMLKSKGITAFMDMDELHGGTFDDKLLEAINDSPAFILILPKGALRRCRKKGDWLTREIVAAVDSGSRIVPVMGEGFTWPRRWPRRVPPQVRQLALYNGVTLNYHYMDAVVDTIIDHMQEDGGSSGTSDLDTFFRNRMRDPRAVTGVDLAFHAGAEWHANQERLELLEDLAALGAPMRVLINTPDAAESIGRHMRHQHRVYVPFAKAVELWQQFAARHDNVQVRLSDTPLLHIYYRFRMQQQEQDAVRVKYYTYGNANIHRNFSRNFEPADDHFALYDNEFTVLWDTAE